MKKQLFFPKRAYKCKNYDQCLDVAARQNLLEMKNCDIDCNRFENAELKNFDDHELFGIVTLIGILFKGGGYDNGIRNLVSDLGYSL